MAASNVSRNSVALTQRQVSRTIEKLAALKANIASLEAEEKELCELLKLQGPGTYTSANYKFLVADVITTKIDSKKAQSFLTPAQIIECSYTSHSVTGRLYAL